MRPALLIIDLQKKYFDMKPGVKQSFLDAIEYINTAISIFRKNDLPVIFIEHADEEGKKESPELVESVDELASEPGDLRIRKNYGNAFNKTPLLEELRRQNIDTVIISGFCAEYCVLSTYRGALDHDLNAIILRGSLASFDKKNIEFVEAISNLISIVALGKFMELF